MFIDHGHVSYAWVIFFFFKHQILDIYLLYLYKYIESLSHKACDRYLELQAHRDLIS